MHKEEIEKRFKKLNTMNKRVCYSIIMTHSDGGEKFATIGIDEFTTAISSSSQAVRETLRLMKDQGLIDVRKYRPKGSHALYNQYRIVRPDEMIPAE